MANDFSTTKISDVLEKEILEKMYAWSKEFHKFVCYPLSACFLQERTIKEIIRFYEKTNNEELVKAFVLYPHDIREKILWCLEDEEQKNILDNMYQFVRTNAFSLSECVDAEKTIQDILESLWPDRFNEYREMKEMEELIAHKMGKKEYSFSKDIYIRKDKKDIYLSINVNLEEYHLRRDELSWHSACYARCLEAYLFFFHGYIQKHGGTVHLDVMYAHKVPNMDVLFTDVGKKNLRNHEVIDEQEYFLLTYRIRNLVRLYPWIKLSDKLESQVQEINCLLKKKKFLARITENNQLGKTTILERIKAKISDDIVNKNFAFWLFREAGKFNKTCIRIIHVADFWWVRDNCLTLVFFEVSSFEKTILRMLLFMGLGIDLFLDNNIRLINGDEEKLGLEKDGCAGSEICNIQCVLYNLAGIDDNHKEVFLMLNDNRYSDRISFRYLEGYKLSDEKLLELQEESIQGTDLEKTKVLNHCYDIFLTLRIEGTPAIYEWHKKAQDIPYQSENLLAVNKLFQIGLTGIDDWDTSYEKVNQYINDRQMSVLEKNLLQIYLDFYNVLFWHFNNDTILTESEMIGFLLNFVPMSQRGEQSNQFYDVKSTFRERFDKLNWVTEEVERENEIYWNYYLNREGETDE